MSGGIIRGLLVGVVVALMSYYLQTLVNNAQLPCQSSLTATLFSLAGFINAVLAESFDDISIIPNFVLTPLSYLGGVFYSVEMLPDFWQAISMGNPILYMINAFRYGFIGVTDIDIQVAFEMTGGFIVTLALFSLYLLHKGIGIKN
jgi:ABC-2 type transport system permease protein